MSDASYPKPTSFSAEEPISTMHAAIAATAALAPVAVVVAAHGLLGRAEI